MSPAPHLCIVTTVHDPLDTRIFYRQARTLAAAGYRVTLLAQGAEEGLIDGVQFKPLAAAPLFGPGAGARAVDRVARRPA